MLSLLLACTGAPPDPEAPPLPPGWIAQVIEEPDAFSAMLDGDGHRDGWIALHANDLPRAVALGGAPGQRAAAQQDALFESLDSLAEIVWRRTFETWEARAGLPAQSAIPVLAALSAYHHGEPAQGASWLDKLDPAAPAEVLALAAELRAGGLDAVTGQTALGRCVVAHRDGGDLAACPTPLHTEDGRALYDPLRFSGSPPQGAEAATGLSALVFGAAWADGPAPPVLPEQWRPGEADVSEDARDRVRAADAALAAWVDHQAEAAPAGLSLLGELELVDVYRSKALARMMQRYLDAGQPKSAQALGLMALDAGAGRAVGATNPPALFVRLAAADLQLGRSREALDMLKPLRDHYPEALGLMETLGDLVVLEGMGSVGDSKEN